MGLRKQRRRSAPDTKKMLLSLVRWSQTSAGMDRKTGTSQWETQTSRIVSLIIIIITVIIALMSNQTLFLCKHTDVTTGQGSVVVQLWLNIPLPFRFSRSVGRRVDSSDKSYDIYIAIGLKPL